MQGLGEWRERSHIGRRNRDRGKEKRTDRAQREVRQRKGERDRKESNWRQTDRDRDGWEDRGTKTRTERKPSQQCSPLISALETLTAGSLSV